MWYVPCFRQIFGVLGCTSDVTDAIVGLYKSANTCPFQKDHGNALAYELPAENIVPL